MTRVILLRIPYPFFVSQIQFATGGCLSFLLIQFLQVCSGLRQLFPAGSVPTDSSTPIFRKNSFFKVLPLGLFQSLGKYLSLCATQVIPIATAASIKALSPVILVMAYRIFYGRKLPFMTYILLLPLLAGVIIIIMADADEKNSENKGLFLAFTLEPSHIKGLAYSFLGVFVMVAAQIYGKELMTWDAIGASKEFPTQSLQVPSVNQLRMSPPVSAGDSSTTQKFLLLPKSVAKNFTRRNSIARLPYSISDLNLNNLEKKSPNTGYNSTPYVDKVEEARHIVNPFASLTAGAVKPDKLTAILYISIIGFCISLTGFLTYEAKDLFDWLTGKKMSTLAFVDRVDAVKVLATLAAVALCHFCQSMVSCLLLGSIPALSFSIASMLKRIVIILVSMLLAVDPSSTQEKWFGRISSAQIQGIGLMGIGLYSYDNWGSKMVQ